mgnify:CR=1 FL=1
MCKTHLLKCPTDEDDDPDMNGEMNCQDCDFAGCGVCNHPDAVYVDGDGRYT